MKADLGSIIRDAAGFLGKNMDENEVRPKSDKFLYLKKKYICFLKIKVLRLESALQFNSLKRNPAVNKEEASAQGEGKESGKVQYNMGNPGNPSRFELFKLYFAVLHAQGRCWRLEEPLFR